MQQPEEDVFFERLNTLRNRRSAIAGVSDVLRFVLERQHLICALHCA
jgi:hypothetical protein